MTKKEVPQRILRFVIDRSSLISQHFMQENSRFRHSTVALSGRVMVCKMCKMLCALLLRKIYHLTRIALTSCVVEMDDDYTAASMAEIRNS
ncbi:Protein of unknown function [Pyronema omphalodes CBS 100304]|uniref:Uncharacterized protein n=1 Tax=Pyronema omphalodes (strain CBS 100304) TaxID=1076935 RepID=U4L2A2_PYROM|nr:Protein of unknown function [Pyronema omphalodes CBS 100304]